MTANLWADGAGSSVAADPVEGCADLGLVAEGRTIPVARVQAVHEGKRRAEARRESGAE